MVQRTSVGGISQMGRATQGVKVMNMKDDDRVSAVALVVESSRPAATSSSPRELPTNVRRGEARAGRGRSPATRRRPANRRPPKKPAKKKPAKKSLGASGG